MYFILGASLQEAAREEVASCLLPSGAPFQEPACVRKPGLSQNIQAPEDKFPVAKINLGKNSRIRVKNLR